jgi:hypothetical protein
LPKNLTVGLFDDSQSFSKPCFRAISLELAQILLGYNIGGKRPRLKLCESSPVGAGASYTCACWFGLVWARRCTAQETKQSKLIVIALNAKFNCDSLISSWGIFINV